MPAVRELLVESFPRANKHYIVCYPFEGRLAHQTLGMLLTRRLERARARPLGFVANDYALACYSLEPVTDTQALLSPDLLEDAGLGPEEPGERALAFPHALINIGLTRANLGWAYFHQRRHAQAANAPIIPAAASGNQMYGVYSKCIAISAFDSEAKTGNDWLYGSINRSYLLRFYKRLTYILTLWMIEHQFFLVLRLHL